MSSPDQDFRNDIQGLRAIAVMAVVLNHLELPGFSGGFVGVDIFFVISGYLITRQLRDEYQTTQTIRLGAFYLRRFRRLFPAAIVTCLLTLLTAFLLSSQEKLELLAESILPALVGVANIHFWLEVGYFDAEAYGKPLLHMWSLGVEEQFYLFWPLLLLTGLKLMTPTTLFRAVIALGVCSFMLNALWFDTELPKFFSSMGGWPQRLENPAESAFYLMPFRVFEFCIGALVALYVTHPRASLAGPFWTSMVWLAVGLVGYAILQFDSAIVFPYWNALAVAIATGVIILVGGHSTLLCRILSNPAMVSIGTVSYSLYLVHWPVIVFYRDVNGPLGPVDVITVLIIMGALTLAMYRWVETPARLHHRHQTSGHRSLHKSPVPLTLALLVGTAAAAVVLPSVEDRVPEHRQTLTNAEWRHQERIRYCQRPIEGLPSRLFPCQLDRGALRTIIVWGDSHAMHLVGGMAENFPDFNIAVAYASGCAHQSGFEGFVREIGARTQACVEHNRQVLDWLNSTPQAHTVLLSSAKRDRPERMSDINNGLVEQLRAAGHDAWVLGDYIRPGKPLAECRAVPDYLLDDLRLKKACLPDADAVAVELAYARDMKRLSSMYIPLHDVQCPSADHCRFTDPTGRSTFRDTHHLSTVGAVFEIRQAMPVLLGHVTSLSSPTGKSDTTKQ